MGVSRVWQYGGRGGDARRSTGKSYVLPTHKLAAYS